MSIRSGKLETGVYVIDLRGWMCPYPKYMLDPLLKKLPGDAKRLVMMVDCPSASTDVPREARARGCDVPEVKQISDGEWQITIALQGVPRKVD